MLCHFYYDIFMWVIVVEPQLKLGNEIWQAEADTKHFVIKQRKACLICFSQCSLVQQFLEINSAFLWKWSCFWRGYLRDYLTIGEFGSIKSSHLTIKTVYIYTCKFKITVPSKAVFVTRVKADFETEHRHSKRDWNKLFCHEEKERSSSQRNIILNSRNITLLFSAIL